MSATDLTNPFKDAKPAQAFAELDPRRKLSGRIRTAPWFETLSPETKDEVVDHALGVIAKNTQLLELEANGGNNAEYYKLTTSVARSGAPNAEDIFVKYASSAKDADPDDALRQHFSRCRAGQPSGNREITVGTLLAFGATKWSQFRSVETPGAASTAAAPEQTKTIARRHLQPDEALELLNSHYLIGKSDQEVAIFRIRDDGVLAFTPPEQFKLDVANIFVRRQRISQAHGRKILERKPTAPRTKNSLQARRHDGAGRVQSVARVWR